MLEVRLVPSALSPLPTQPHRILQHAAITVQQASPETRKALIAPAALRRSVTTTRLPIAPRQQWNENNGYCGETSIQSCALYFGTYVSQYRVRAFINPDQQSQLLIGVNEQTALRALHLTFEQWNSRNPIPQWQNYLAWVKRSIQKGNPVIGTMYIKGMTDLDYDHIVPIEENTLKVEERYMFTVASGLKSRLSTLDYTIKATCTVKVIQLTALHWSLHWRICSEHRSTFK